VNVSDDDLRDEVLKLFSTDRLIGELYKRGLRRGVHLGPPVRGLPGGSRERGAGDYGMKSRLTQEDWTILCDFVERTGMPIIELSERADRRDAALMLAWAQGWPIDLGGDDENGECLFWGDPPVPAPEAL
jgi:hypothetical protein